MFLKKKKAEAPSSPPPRKEAVPPAVLGAPPADDAAANKAPAATAALPPATAAVVADAREEEDDDKVGLPSPATTTTMRGASPFEQEAATAAAAAAASASRPRARSTAAAAPFLPALERRVSISGRPIDVLRACLAAQRNELVSVFACLAAKARAGNTPVLRPHVLVDECARLEGAAPAPYRGVGDDDQGGDDDDDDADCSRASLAAVFRSCVEVLVVLPPNGNGRAAAPPSASALASAPVCRGPVCAPCSSSSPSPNGGSTSTRVALALRPRPGVTTYVYFRGAASVEELSTSAYLALKERVAADAERADNRQASSSSSSLPPLQEENPFAVLEIDLAPFNREFPKLRMPSSIGDGVRFLNRYLSGLMFQRPAGDGSGIGVGVGVGAGGIYGGGDLSSSPPVARRSLSGGGAPNYMDEGGGGGFGFGAGGGAGFGLMQGALTQGKVQLFEFLRTLQAPSGESLLVARRVIDSPGALANALLRADRRLDDLPDSAPFSAAAPRLAALGLERGWGATVGGVRDMCRLLLDVLEAPSPEALERFLSRLPLVTSVAILSPHGFFGQEDGVLGLPDTGGQVVYLVDMIKGLEREMRRRLEEQGLADVEPRVVLVTRLIPDAPPDTTCAQRLERVAGTESAVILRVPFRTADGSVLRPWVSRFDVSEFLERFSLDVERELLAMLGQPPSLVIGNYSDGGMVASLLARRMSTIQCHIAHALEVSKYQDADLMWRRYAPKYHFDVQLLTDMIAINSADFVIASSAQEIRGSLHDAVPGQYELMRTLVLPGLCRIVNACDIQDPKFNVVPPGCDPEIYFSFSEASRRLTALQPELERLIYGDDTGPRLARGSIGADPERRALPLLFTMARLDRVKNVTGLVEWYAQCPRLRARCNLLIVGGVVDPSLTTDREEKAECERMHALFDAHGLDGCVRWVVSQKARVRNGELYRCVADTGGAFVQPATFEAFGLTVVEAMASGLPCFATKNGGPSEIIRDRESGFHIDPFHGSSAAELMADFFERSAREGGGPWRRVSEAGLRRIEERYTWRLYAGRLLSLTGCFAFWRLVSDLERVETRRYLQSLYCLLLRPRVEAAGRAAAERDAAAAAAAAAAQDARGEEDKGEEEGGGAAEAGG